MELERVLKEKGWRKLDLAEQMGVKRQYIARLFGNPTEKTIKRVAEVLGVDVWELFVSHENALKKIAKGNYKRCPHCNLPINVKVKVDLSPADEEEEE